MSCMNIYIYMCVCICVCVSVCVYVFIYLFICLFIYLCVCLFVYLCVSFIYLSIYSLFIQWCATMVLQTPFLWRVALKTETLTFHGSSRRKQRNQRTQIYGDHGGCPPRFLKHHEPLLSQPKLCTCQVPRQPTFQVAASGHTPTKGGGYSCATLFGHHGFITCRESLPHRAFLWPDTLLSRPPSLPKGTWTPSQGFQRRTWQTLNPPGWEGSSRIPGFGSQPARFNGWRFFLAGTTCFENLMPWQPKIGDETFHLRLPHFWPGPYKTECLRAGDALLSSFIHILLSKKLLWLL